MLHALSNQKDRSVYRRALEAKARIDLDSPVPAQKRRRPAQGAIKAAILDVLAAAEGPLNTPAILECLDGPFPEPITKHTVNSFLSVASRDDRSPVQRVAPGLYELDSGSEASAA